MKETVNLLRCRLAHKALVDAFTDIGLGGFLVPLAPDNRDQFMPSVRQQVWVYPDGDANHGGCRSAEADVEETGVVTLTIHDAGHFIRRMRLDQFREMEPDLQLQLPTWPRLALNPIDLSTFLNAQRQMNRPAQIRQMPYTGRPVVPAVIGNLGVEPRNPGRTFGYKVRGNLDG